jgi:hypothetical protein
MNVSTRLVPGSMIRWRKRCFVVIDCDGMDTVIAQENGKSRLERIPVKEALPDHSQRARKGHDPALRLNWLS